MKVQLATCASGGPVAPYPQLSEDIQEGLNAISYENLGPERAYCHYILQYGVRAIGHVALMTEAQKIITGKSTLEDLTGKFCLTGSEADILYSEGRFLSAPLSVLTSSLGIFVPIAGVAPNQNPWGLGYGEGAITFFYPDYLNLLIMKDMQYAKELVNRTWSVGDLRDPALVANGLKFGLDLWISSASNYHKQMQSSEAWKSEKIKGLVLPLVVYYDEMVEALQNGSK